MPVTRKRKAHSPETNKQTAQKSINAYGRVTKTQTVKQSAKKRKVDEQIEGTAPDINTDQGLPSLNPQPAPQQSKKRPRETEEEATTTTRTTPQNKRFRNALPPTPADTPSKKASKLFEKLNIETSSSSSSDLNVPKNETAYDTPPLTPRSFKTLGTSQSSTKLPAPVQDLARLFSSFLTSTSLFCAHNGSGSPLYLDSLLPNVTRGWKKRIVSPRDIRVLLAILGDEDRPFDVADNGEGQLCLEPIDNANTAPGHFNQPELNQRFQTRLNRSWHDWMSTSSKAIKDVDGFLRQLPECAITTSELAPSKRGGLSKGEERLNDLKSGAVSARAAESTLRKPVVKAEARTASAVSSRGSSLLDRILAKQQANSGRESGPTQEDIDRKAALDRIEDISRVLELLVNGRSRASFSSHTMVSHLQNSLRNPISGDEVERCLTLMAKEITPGFVSMIHAGQVRGIVVTKTGKPSVAELKQRLERAHSYP